MIWCHMNLNLRKATWVCRCSRMAQKSGGKRSWRVAAHWPHLMKAGPAASSTSLRTPHDTLGFRPSRRGGSCGGRCSKSAVVGRLGVRSSTHRQDSRHGPLRQLTERDCLSEQAARPCGDMSRRSARAGYGLASDADAAYTPALSFPSWAHCASGCSSKDRNHQCTGLPDPLRATRDMRRDAAHACLCNLSSPPTHLRYVSHSSLRMP